jgi:hypothetical protein
MEPELTQATAAVAIDGVKLLIAAVVFVALICATLVALSNE